MKAIRKFALTLFLFEAESDNKNCENYVKQETGFLSF